MAHVTRKYLGLQDEEHRLYSQTATIVGTQTALLPRDEWYVESIAQIQNYRSNLAEDETTRCERIPERIIESLGCEVLELDSDRNVSLR